MALAETAELVVKLTLRDQLSSGLGKAERGLKNLDRATANTQRSLSQTATNLGRIGTAAAVASAGIVVGAVKAAGDFEAQLNTINTIARETPKNLQAIGDSIRAIARDTGTPLADLTAGYYDLLSAGIKAADAAKVLTAANTLSIGGLSTAAEAVDLLTTAINTYGGDASKAQQFTDEFAKSIERGKVTAAELASTYASVGPLAASLAIENAELAAGYATLTAQGTAAGEAATQMASAMTALLRKTGDLEKLEKQTGRNYAAIAGDKGLNVALEMLRTDADKAGVSLIDLVGRKEALLYILQTTGPNLAKYNADLAAMGDAAGTAAGQMAERQQGLNFQLARLKALALDAGITVGNALLPKLVPLVAKLNEFITKNQGKIADFGTKLASGFERVAEALGKVDWQPFIDGLSITAQVAKTVVGAFMSLPADVQKLVVTGLAVQKLTGGLPTSIVKDIVGGVGGGLASKIPGVGKLFVQPVFVTNWPLGGLGGAAGAGGVAGGISKGALLAGGIMTALAAAAVIAVQQDLSNRSTAISADIKQNLDANIGNKSTAELQTALAGVQQGIRDLQSNPLYVLVAGDALANLQSMEASLQAQLDRTPPKQDNDPNTRQWRNDNPERAGEIRAERAENRKRLAAIALEVQRKGEQTANSVDTAKSAITQAESETARETNRASGTISSTVRSGSSAIVGALRGLPTPIVNVNVTASNVTKSITYQNSVGPGNGSAGGGTGINNGPMPV